MKLQRLLALSALTLASMVAGTITPVAAAPGNAQIDGVAKIDFVGCTELPSPFTFRMTGSLEGC